MSTDHDTTQRTADGDTEAAADVEPLAPNIPQDAEPDVEGRAEQGDDESDRHALHYCKECTHFSGEPRGRYQPLTRAWTTMKVSCAPMKVFYWGDGPNAFRSPCGSQDCPSCAEYRNRRYLAHMDQRFTAEGGVHYARVTLDDVGDAGAIRGRVRKRAARTGAKMFTVLSRALSVPGHGVLTPGPILHVFASKPIGGDDPPESMVNLPPEVAFQVLRDVVKVGGVLAGKTEFGHVQSTTANTVGACEECEELDGRTRLCIHDRSWQLPTRSRDNTRREEEDEEPDHEFFMYGHERNVDPRHEVMWRLCEDAAADEGESLDRDIPEDCQRIREELTADDGRRFASQIERGAQLLDDNEPVTVHNLLHEMGRADLIQSGDIEEGEACPDCVIEVGDVLPFYDTTRTLTPEREGRRTEEAST